MRIVQLNPYHYPFMGGIEHRIHHISKELAKKHEVFVVTGKLPGTSWEEEIDGYTVIRLRSRLIDIYNPPYISTSGIEEKLDEIDPDVVDFHYRWAPSYRKAMKRYAGPKVFTFHNTFGEGEGVMKAASKLNDIYYTRFIIGFNRIICVSKFVRDDLINRGFPKSKLEVIPNGVEIPETPPADEEDFILFIGRLVRTKGLDYLIEAMREIDTRLIIAGKGPEYNRLKRKVITLGLEKKITFPGRVTEEEKQKLLSTCKLFVFPSVWESYGIAAAEAMSYGKPVVASRVGGLPEVVNKGGILVPPRDPHALAEAINSLLGDEKRRRDLGNFAREHISQFTWDTAARRIERVYSEVSEDNDSP